MIIAMNVLVILSVELITVLVLSTHKGEIVVKNLQPLLLLQPLLPHGLMVCANPITVKIFFPLVNLIDLCTKGGF